LQLFTNADTGHAIRVLQRLGLEDCFERIISFDTLNSLDSTNPPNDKDGCEIFDFCEYTRRPDSDMVLPKTPVVCKPFEDAFEKAFKLADIDPQRTVRRHISLVND
jgi:putative hydrolase of the HAD superfamily